MLCILKIYIYIYIGEFIFEPIVRAYSFKRSYVSQSNTNNSLKIEMFLTIKLCTHAKLNCLK